MGPRSVPTSECTIEASIGDVSAFLEQIFGYLAQYRINVSAFELDHICYRAATLKSYAQKKLELSKWGHLLHESIIAGRPIATFKLHQPLVWHDRKINVLELPAPKSEQTYADGLEHVEFVIDEPFASFTARYPALTFVGEGAMKAINPEIKLVLAVGLAVKFHHQSLERVVADELAQRNRP